MHSLKKIPAWAQMKVSLCREIRNDFQVIEVKKGFIKKSEIKYPRSPTICLALTVAGQNGYRRRKYCRYRNNVSCLLTLVAILGRPNLRRSLTVLVAC